jgi:hypothetical protein
MSCCKQSGLEVQKPDEFLSNLFDLDPPRMMDVFHMLARRYKKPPMEIERILNALALREIGALVRARLLEPSAS